MVQNVSARRSNTDSSRCELSIEQCYTVFVDCTAIRRPIDPTEAEVETADDEDDAGEMICAPLEGNEKDQYQQMFRAVQHLFAVANNPHSLYVFKWCAKNHWTRFPIKKTNFRNPGECFSYVLSIITDSCSRHNARVA